MCLYLSFSNETLLCLRFTHCPMLYLAIVPVIVLCCSVPCLQQQISSLYCDHITTINVCDDTHCLEHEDTFLPRTKFHYSDRQEYVKCEMHHTLQQRLIRMNRADSIHHHHHHHQLITRPTVYICISSTVCTEQFISLTNHI